MKMAGLDEMVTILNRMLHCLQVKELHGLGEMMNTAWVIKRKLAPGIANSVIEEIYDCAIKAGAVGGTILGAGEAEGFPCSIASRSVRKRYGLRFPD